MQEGEESTEIDEGIQEAVNTLRVEEDIHVSTYA